VGGRQREVVAPGRVGPIWTRHLSAALSRAAVDAGTGRDRQAVQKPREQVSRRRPVKSLRRRRAIRSTDQIIVQHGQRLQLPHGEPVQGMVFQRKLAVATLHTGTAPLEQVGADLSLAF